MEGFCGTPKILNHFLKSLKILFYTFSFHSFHILHYYIYNIIIIKKIQCVEGLWKCRGMCGNVFFNKEFRQVVEKL